MALDQTDVQTPSPAWGEPPQSHVTESLSLAEQLLDYAEMFENEGDYSAACTQARCAVEGLEALAATRPHVDAALRSLLERATLELGLYEARWATWQQKNDERNETYTVKEKLALERDEAPVGFALEPEGWGREVRPLRGAA
jgi:hypothetical protein